MQITNDEIEIIVAWHSTLDILIQKGTIVTNWSPGEELFASKVIARALQKGKPDFYSPLIGTQIREAASQEFEVSEREVRVLWDGEDYSVIVAANRVYDEGQYLAVFEDGQWEFEELEE